MEPQEVLLSEAEWLEGAVSNARGFSDEYIRGFKTATQWVRFHGEHPHLLEERFETKEKLGMSLTTTVMCDKCGTLGTKSMVGFNPDAEGIEVNHYCFSCVQKVLHEDLRNVNNLRIREHNVNQQ